MSKILSFCFPLKDSVQQEDIKNLVNEWIHGSEYYNFEETLLSDDELESSFYSVQGKNHSVLTYCQTNDPSKGIRYLAFHLENKDDSNLTWEADVIFSEPESAAGHTDVIFPKPEALSGHSDVTFTEPEALSDHSDVTFTEPEALSGHSDVTFTEPDALSGHSDSAGSVTVSLSRSCSESSLPSDCSQRIKYPSIIRMLFDKQMIRDNTFLPLNRIQSVKELTESGKSKIKEIFSKMHRTEFPVLYLYSDSFLCREQPALIQGETSLDRDIQNVLQTSVSEEKPFWQDSETMQSLLYIFSRVMYIYTAQTPEEHEIWNQITGNGEAAARDHNHETVCKNDDKENESTGISENTPYGDRICKNESDQRDVCRMIPVLRFYYPWLNLEYDLPITSFSAYHQLYHALMLLLQYCQQNHDSSLPDWNAIQNLITFNDSNEKTAAFYLHMNQSIANAMQKRRKELHMTQGDLAEKVGTTKMLISRLERLQTIKVRRNIVLKLEKSLSLPPGSLEKLSRQNQENIPGKGKDMDTDMHKGIDTDMHKGMNTDMHKGMDTDMHKGMNKNKDIDMAATTASFSTEQPSFCHICGKPLRDGGNFCPWCGTRIR